MMEFAFPDRPRLRRQVNDFGHRLRRALWLMPALAVVGGVMAASLTAATDLAIPGFVNNFGGLLTTASADGAQELVKTVASTSLTVATYVFSVTIVALQVAASQYSPRVPQQFIRDRGTQIVMSLFIFCFVYSLSTIRTIRADAEVVPQVAVTVSFLLAVATVGGFVYFIAHILTVIRVEHVLRRLERTALEAIARSYGNGYDTRPVEALPAMRHALIVRADRDAVLQRIHVPELLRLATRQDLCVRIEGLPGAQFLTGMAVATAWQASGRDAMDPGRTLVAVRRGLAFGAERAQTYDPAFCLTQVVDIALRAASPAINDPTTARNAIRSAEVCLAELLDKETGNRLILDDAGDVRLVIPGRSFGDHVDLVTTPIRQAAADDLSIVLRLFQMLDRLSRLAPDDAARAVLVREGDILHAQATQVAAQSADAERIDEARDRLRAIASHPSDTPDQEAAA